MALVIKNLSISIGKNDILLDESVGFEEGTKVGVLGRNGAGKTTLLKAILGQVDYLGKIEFDGKAAYFSQHIDLDPDKTVKEIIQETAPIHHQNEFEGKLRVLEKKLSNPDTYKNAAQASKLTAEYIDLQSKMRSYKSPIVSNKLKSILQTLEVKESWLDEKVGSLSTGQRVIIALVQILSSDAQLLLLDEPTNHLDFKRLNILEQYLHLFKGIVVIVTHDRYFLDKVCNKILKIENSKWTVYNSNYSGYVKTRKANFEAQETAYKLENKYIADQKDKIARIGKSPQKVKQGQYRERLLEKREVIEKPDLDKSEFEVHFEASPIDANVIMELFDVTIGYDTPLLSNINFNLGANERIVLIGGNGTGKSTLLKTIEGRVEPLSGQISINYKVRIGYADQELENLTDSSTLYDEIFSLLGSQTKTRQQLSMVGFISNEEVFKPISKLSMGEKARLNLLKILITKPNLLLLDEPTNHLDIDAREIIEDAFLRYDGAILAVSHDRYFIEKIAQRKFEVVDGTIRPIGR